MYGTILTDSYFSVWSSAQQGINFPVSAADSKILRRNLIEAGFAEPNYRNAAHHIVAGNASAAIEARKILQSFGIDINAAVNGVFLPIEQGVSDAYYHVSLHTDTYYQKVTELLRNASSRYEVTLILNQIREQLLNGTFLQ